jgi:hypothetical protein
MLASSLDWPKALLIVQTLLILLALAALAFFPYTIVQYWLRLFLENIFLKKFLKIILEKFERKKSIFKLVFYTLGILTTKMTTKMYTKLASIEINDEILSKVGGIRNFFGKNF